MTGHILWTFNKRFGLEMIH